MSEGQTEDHMLIHGVSHGKSTHQAMYRSIFTRIAESPDRDFQRSPARDRDRGNQRQRQSETI